MGLGVRLVLLSSSLAVSTSSLAHAEPDPGPELIVVAPPTCTDRSAVRQAVELMLARPWADYQGQELAITFEVEPSRAGLWWGRLSITGHTGQGERRFEARSCGLVVRAAALMIAFALEVSGPTETATRAAQPASSPEAVELATRSALRPIRIEDDGDPSSSLAGSPLAVIARLELSGAVGVLAAPSGGFSFQLGLAEERLRFELGVRYWFEQPVAIRERPDAGTTARIIAGTFGGCLTSSPPIALRGCLRGELGALGGGGFGLADVQQVWRFWAAVTPAVLLAVDINDWAALTTGLELSLALGRPALEVVNVGEVFRPSFVSGHVSLGVELFRGWF